MWIIIGLIALLALLPIIVLNQTKFRKDQISKKAKSYGINLGFKDKQYNPKTQVE